MLGDPTTPLTSIAVWNDLDGGPTASGELINERTVMALSTVYTCVTKLAEAVASCSCHIVRQTGNSTEEAKDNYLYDLLANNPNPEMSAFTFWQTVVGNSALAGNGYAEIERLPDGSVNNIWPHNPTKTKPIRTKDGKLAFQTSDGMKDGQYRIIKSEDMLHFPLFGMDGILGVGPVTAARESFALAKAAEKYGARWFGNGAHPDSLLIAKVAEGEEVPSPKEQKEICETFQENYGGSNSGKQAILFGNWTIEKTGLSPEDSQFLGTRNYQRADIAAMFHMDPHQVGDTSKMTAGNYVQSQLSFVTDALRPIINRIEQEVNRKLLRSKGLAPSNLAFLFDLTDRLRGDAQSTAQAIASFRQWGCMTVNEIRVKFLGLPNIGPQGDIFLQPVNMMDADLGETTEPTLVQSVDSPEPDEDAEDDDNPSNPPPPKKKPAPKKGKK